MSSNHILEQQLYRSIENQNAINALLRLSLSCDALASILDQAIDIILSVSWLQILAKGAVFLNDREAGELVLTSSHALAPELSSLCARVRHGHCLCGRAAATRKIQFASSVNHRHDVRYEGMEPHGHYNVPILDENREVLGVLVLYLKHGHRSQPSEREFLQTVADTLALVIKRKRTEGELQAANLLLRDRVGELERTKSALEARSRELEGAKQRLEQIAYFDSLTGLANRAHCQKDLAEKAAHQPPGYRLAVIQIDLDNFKRVNDTLGHAAGDFLLQTLGERLKLLQRELDNFAAYRWGGDEFVALVEGEDYRDLELICHELTDIISVPVKYESAVLRPTTSIGVARYPEDAPNIESLMVFSDLALYKTKELGRDGYQFFTSAMKEKIDSESRIERELRVAIEERQLELYFQPQLDSEDERVTGVEALLRWNHPERGLVSPGEFLGVAESTGLATAISRQVFEQAMTAIRSWVEAGLDFGRLAINLSPSHLRQGSMQADLFAAMDRYAVSPQHLAVEFLESFLLDDSDSCIAEFLAGLRQRGINIELDDFGTGYASLSHLSRMPVNGLKIDRTFIRHMLDNSKQQSIVSMLVSISRLMKLRLVCEGVETGQQAAALRELGPCAIQGYYIARPMSLAATTCWMKDKRNLGLLKPQLGLTPVLPGRVEGGRRAAARCA
jgi:diguanylate cyclase (GGDEF)-like protein